MDEKTVREELVVFVAHRCCFGTKPAKTWRFKFLFPSKCYVASFQTFVQLRRLALTREPYFEGPNYGSRDIDIWDIETSGKEPGDFENREIVIEVPKSDKVEVCNQCKGSGSIPCSSCHSSEKAEKNLYGDSGEETKKPCSTCFSLGTIKCAGCEGAGSLLIKSFVVVSWVTVSVKSVLRADSFSSVPDEKFIESTGVPVFRVEDVSLSRVSHADNAQIEEVSNEVIRKKAESIPHDARILRERLVVSELPATLSVFEEENKEFKFYVVGENHSKYLEGYPLMFLEWLPFSCLFSSCKLL